MGNSAIGEDTMAQATLLSRIALGTGGALILATAALAQTSPPAPAPAAAPAPATTAAPAPAASPFPPTATITTPGYPGVGPADPKLRVVNLPNGRKCTCCRRHSTPPNGAGSTMPN